MIGLIERRKYRSSIEKLTKLTEKIERSLERGTPLDAGHTAFLNALTDTTDLGAQFHAITELLDQTREQFDAKLLAAAPKSLSHFVEYMTPEEPPARHHDWMCEKLEAMEARELKRLIVSMPPGHAKSKFCSRYFPAWYLGRRPNHKFIQGGHSQDFVENQFGKYVRGIIKEDRFKKVFPGIAISQESSAAGFWQIAGKHGSYLAKGVGQGIAGFRGNIACVDDPYAKLEDAESATIREKVYNWFTADFMTRLLPGSPIFIVSTRWHSDDICGRLERMTKAGEIDPWVIINLPAISDGNNDALGRGPDEPLWPDFYDTAFLTDLRNQLPSKIWNSLYMGEPVDAQGGVVQAEGFHRYTTFPVDERSESGLIVKQNVLRTTVSVDTASKTSERNDYTAITVWRQGVTDLRHYLVHVERKRVEFDDMVKLIEKTALEWGAHQILVEDKGSGTQYIQTRALKAPCPVLAITVPNTSTKEFRFDGVSPMFSGGLVLLPEKAPWLADYERELLAFPNGTFDDQVDSTSQYLDRHRIKRRLGTQKMKGTH